MKTNTIHITDIPKDCRYTGYLWQSDQTSPWVFRNETIPPLGEGVNPFIIEGQLYDEDNNLSYSIKFIDGSCLVKQFDLKEPGSVFDNGKYYLVNRLEGVSKLCFREFWQPEEDPYCEGMKVLQPAELVFVGFNCKED